MVFGNGYFKSLNKRGVMQLMALEWQGRYDGDIIPQYLHMQKYTNKKLKNVRG